jgi:hypothetical protein
MSQELIVSGEMRSGTTFMANFLNSQEDISCYADFVRKPLLTAGILNIVDYNCELTEKQSNIIFSEFKAECDLFNIPLYLEFSRNDYNNIFEFYELAFRALDAFTKKQNKLVGIKFTAYQKQIFKFLDRKFKIIYLIRDPRDVLISSQNRFANFDLIKFALSWKNSYHSIKKHRENPDFLLVKYEDFINKDSNLIKKLNDFCLTDLNFRVSELKLRNGINYIENSSFGDIKETFDKKAINRWERFSSEKSLLIINKFLKEELNELSYKNLDAEPDATDYFKFNFDRASRNYLILRIFKKIVKIIK